MFQLKVIEVEIVLVEKNRNYFVFCSNFLDAADTNNDADADADADVDVGIDVEGLLRSSTKVWKTFTIKAPKVAVIEKKRRATF